MSERYVEKCARTLYEAIRQSTELDIRLPSWTAWVPGGPTHAAWCDVSRAVLEAGRLSENDDAAQALVDNGCGDLYKRDDDDLDTARSWLREAEDAALVGREITRPCPGSRALWYTNAGEEGVHRCAACHAPFESKDLTPDGFVPLHVGPSREERRRAILRSRT